MLIKWKKDYAGALGIYGKLLTAEGPGNGATYYKIAGMNSLLNKPDDSLKFLTLAISAGKDWGSKDNATENWIDTNYHILIDVASIRKGDDGLVYFNHRDKDPDALPMKRAFAFDCAKGLIYDSMFGDEWKSKGIPVTEGTPGEAWKTFVCLRMQ